MKNEIEKIFKTYIANLEQDLIDRWNWWQKDVSTPELYEVISGIISRQICLAINIVGNNSLWNSHVGPVLMRSLIDNYINFAWILIDPLKRSQRFIYFGLGQEKLHLEHFKNQFSEVEVPDQIRMQMDAIEGWIDSQRYTFLTDVNLKSWPEVPVRQMAEEAGCTDLYNHAYQPFSSVAHNMWNHIGRYNMQTSSDPLHKYLRHPVIMHLTPTLYYVELTIKYVDKMFDKFDKTFGYKPTRDTASEFHKSLSTLSAKVKPKKRSKKNDETTGGNST
ncbi:MAG: DUF5677 domain-containing protein [Bacteroidia bacterium]